VSAGRRPRFGIKASPQHTTYEDILRVWEEADTLPALEHAWVFDHFMPLGADPTGPCLEGWTLLAALAARTERLRVGVMVTGNTYRHPAVLANMGATVDLISHGRLDMGLGAGWNELEHTAYGIPLPPAGPRIRAMGEACEVIRRMWTEEAPDFDGQYYQVRGARCEPKPAQRPHPPLVIGGGGEKLTLRMVARYADIWNMAGGSPEEFAAKSAILDQHCAAVGRDPSSIERSIQLRVDPEQPEAARDTVRRYLAVGASHIVLILPVPYRASIARRLAEEVAAPLLAGA
jgi:F420-dependent oxidoreductase-like protein